MRTLTLVLSFFLAVPLASGELKPTREVEFWQATGFDLSQASRYLSNRVCRASIENAGACVEALKQGEAALRLHVFKDLSSINQENLARFDFEDHLSKIDQLSSQPDSQYPKALVFGSMVNAFLRQFDAHAIVLPQAYLNVNFAQAEKEISGIGVEMEINGKGLYIRRIYPDSPAENSGLRVNDRILKIAKDVVKPGLKAVRSLREFQKPLGTRLGIEFEHRGEVLSTTVQIRTIPSNDLSLQFIQFGSKTFGVAKLKRFSLGVCDELVGHLGVIKQDALKKIDGFILDVRDNAGGNLSEAACVMSLFTVAQSFVTKKPLPSQLPKELGLDLSFSETQQDNWRKGIRSVLFPKLPLVVLVNSSSASASEMLAAALQDHKRGWVIGEKTFGKGSTQTVKAEGQNQNLDLVFTVSRYYRPNGEPLQLIGVTPNFIVPFQRSASEAERNFLREGDLFGVKLAREVNAKPWQEDRLEQVRRIHNCLRKTRADSWFDQSFQSKFGYEDFQTSSALAILHCDVKPAT